MSATKSFIAISLVILAISARAFGEGGPPLIGDDPGTPGNGHWEINLACIGVETPHQYSLETPHIDLNYGLGDHIQLKYEVGFLMGKEEGQSWTSGLNNSLFGVKYRFLDEEKNGVDMSTYPQVYVNTSQYMSKSGFVARGTDVYLPIEIAKTFGNWEPDAEAGFQFNQYGSNQFIGGFILGYKLTEKIELLGEVRTTVNDNLRTDVILDGGARIGINDNLTIIFAGGRSIRTDDQSTTLYIYAGCRVTF